MITVSGISRPVKNPRSISRYVSFWRLDRPWRFFFSSSWPLKIFEILTDTPSLLGCHHLPSNHLLMCLTSSSGNPNTKFSRLRTVSSLLESPQKKSQRPARQSHASSCSKILNLQWAEYTQPLLSSNPTGPSHQGLSHCTLGSMHLYLPSSLILQLGFQVVRLHLSEKTTAMKG